jgi:predicted RNA-binding protein
MLKEIIKIANELDNRGLVKEADYLDKIAIPLSEIERDQLGTSKPGSKYDYISSEDYDTLRESFVEKKKDTRSYKTTDEFGPIDPELTAYTPGETLDLLKHPKVVEWFDMISNYDIPEEYEHIIMVPCSASKPWGKTSCPSSAKYYKAYHRIKDRLNEQDKKAFWVTISEPLGIVPETHWDSFPAYDNPGLFKDVSQQMSGMTRKDWDDRFGERYNPPFDEKAREESMDILGDVISKFIGRNQRDGRKWISFIDATKGKLATHREMVDVAKSYLEGWEEISYPKTDPEAARPTESTTYDYMSEKLNRELSNE